MPMLPGKNLLRDGHDSHINWRVLAAIFIVSALTFLGAGYVFNDVRRIKMDSEISSLPLPRSPQRKAKSITDVQKLLANQSAGPGPGQVVVQQSDIDALTTSIQSLTAADVAADATVNPPPATT